MAIASARQPEAEEEMGMCQEAEKLRLEALPEDNASVGLH